MVRLQEADELRMDRLRYFVMDAGDKELAAFLQTGSQPYRIQANNMASTVKSIAQSCVQSLAHASNEPDFSVRKWVRNGQGFIFITPRDRDRVALVTLINAFMNLAIAEALSPQTGKRFRPIAVVVDELASFDLDDLEGVLEKGRKFGLVAFAGIQNIAQLRKKYGPDGATTLLACFRTKVIFNPGDAETAKRMAEELGSQTIERREVSYSHSPGRTTSTTNSWRREEGLAVSPEDLQSLPDLTAYLKLGGNFPIAKITIPRRKR
jgi:type IV secretory pathway TraG/TraD family ATPase VirD4